jgi:hypothetical protein
MLGPPIPHNVCEVKKKDVRLAIFDITNFTMCSVRHFSSKSCGNYPQVQESIRFKSTRATAVVATNDPAFAELARSASEVIFVWKVLRGQCTITQQVTYFVGIHYILWIKQSFDLLHVMH